MSEIKPCPFCGEKLKKCKNRENETYWQHSKGTNCFCDGVFLYEKDIKSWNTRTTTPPDLSPFKGPFSCEETPFSVFIKDATGRFVFDVTDSCFQNKLFGETIARLMNGEC